MISVFVVLTKYFTHVESRAVSGVFQNIDRPTPSPPSECVRVGRGVNILEDVRHWIDLLQYNLSTVVPLSLMIPAECTLLYLVWRRGRNLLVGFSQSERRVWTCGPILFIYTH
jgi:hypothetical protein